MTVTVHYLSRCKRYVASSFNVRDEAAAKLEAANATRRGYAGYYLVPTKHPVECRRVDFGGSVTYPPHCPN